MYLESSETKLPFPQGRNQLREENSKFIRKGRGKRERKDKKERKRGRKEEKKGKKGEKGGGRGKK